MVKNCITIRLTSDYPGAAAPSRRPAGRAFARRRGRRSRTSLPALLASYREAAGHDRTILSTCPHNAPSVAIREHYANVSPFAFTRRRTRGRTPPCDRYAGVVALKRSGVPKKNR
ncbi:hypothetical protein EVAR_88831_1 [Eumeta japonica]|uniref:Uncharacterized protein n=1 Tax=Eumeta variegata TaxID=151549 RepID=A0A4C1Y7Y2_EUMVA|nr:hypothetical protein EVAR_88831_1 [Eumeta japonica]